MARTQVTPLTTEGKQKFNRLFAALRKMNLVARQNFTCCQSCGCAEINEMFADRENDILVGYAFYHKQDGARLCEEQGVYVAFGNRDERDPTTAEEIGKWIVEAAHKLGLFCTWNGSAATRIYVSEVPQS